MLNEPASSLDKHVPERRHPPTYNEHEDEERDALYTEIREAAAIVLNIHQEDFPIADDINAQRMFMLPEQSKLLVKFTGRLLMESETAYERLDLMFAQHNLLPIFRDEDGKHAVYVLQGRTTPNDGGSVLSVILFILTVFSVLAVGANMAISEIAFENPFRAAQLSDNFLRELWRGWPYASAILLILGGHELGHYFMARRHRTAASLPYFIPFPFGIFGTFGAAIRLREPMKNRKVLFDIGAAGPIAGLVFAIPIVLIGLATSRVAPITSFEGGLVEGNSVIYALSKILVFGRFLPDGSVDVAVNQLAWAGWTGLLVTGLNLIPIGQLDGGHVLYSLLGERARQFYLPVMGALLALAVLVANELLVFVFLIFFIGSVYAVPLDDITTLDTTRQRLALATLAVFFLVFVPTPLTPVASNTAQPGGGSLIWLPAVLMTLWTMRRDIRLRWPFTR